MGNVVILAWPLLSVTLLRYVPVAVPSIAPLVLDAVPFFEGLIFLWAFGALAIFFVFVVHSR